MSEAPRRASRTPRAPGGRRQAQDVPVARTVEDSLKDDPTALEYWLERAAIAEYCGGLTRQQAEDSATKQLRVWEAARRMRDASR